jgi:hypothetical protein
MKAFLLIILILSIVETGIYRNFGDQFQEWCDNYYEIDRKEEENEDDQDEAKALLISVLAVVYMVVFAFAVGASENFQYLLDIIWKSTVQPLFESKFNYLNGQYLLVATVWWLLMFPAGRILGLFLEAYYEPENYKDSGLEKAGKLIGQTERTLVLIFYLGNSLNGIAFLIIAKSILRFGDLQKGHEDDDQNNKNENGSNDKESENENGDDNEHDGFSISEYIILGSLLSITLAIIGGVLIDLTIHETSIKPIEFLGNTQPNE